LKLITFCRWGGFAAAVIAALTKPVFGGSGSMSGTMKMSYSYLHNPNPLIITQDDADLGLSAGSSGNVDIMALYSGETWSIMGILYTGIDSKRIADAEAGYFDYYQVHSRYDNSVIFKADDLVENLSIKASRDKLIFTAGDIQASAGNLVLGSKTIRGFKAENETALEGSKISADHIDAVFLGTRPVDLGSLYLRSIVRKKDSLGWSVFAGRSERRKLSMSEGGESGFNPSNPADDLNGNGYRDPSSSAAFRQYIAGAKGKISLGPAAIESGAVFLQDDAESLDYKNSDARFVGISTPPIAKFVFGGSAAIEAIPDTLRIGLESGARWKDPDISDSQREPFTLVSSHIVNADITEWAHHKTAMAIRFAQSGYEDGAGTSSAEEDTCAVTARHTYANDKKKLSQAGVNTEYSRDNTIGLFRRTYTRHSLRAGADSTIGLGDGSLGIDGSAAYTWTSYEDEESPSKTIRPGLRAKYKKKKQFAAHELQITPQIGYTYFTDQIKDTWYHKVDPGLGAVLSLNERTISIGADIRYSWRRDQDEKISRNADPAINLAAKLLNGKINLQGTIGYVYDFSDAVPVYDSSRGDFFKAGFGLETALSSGLILSINYRFVGKQYEIYYQDSLLTQAGDINSYNAHIAGAAVTLSF